MRRDRVSADAHPCRSIGLIAAIGGLLVAGCGSSTPSKPVAQRICGGSGRAAAAELRRGVTVTIAGRDVTNVVCTLHAGRESVQIVSQASPAAYTAFDTETSHQSQVYGPAAPGVHQANRTPLQIIVPKAVAAVWVPAQAEIIATNTLPTRPSGAYVTVTVNGRHVAADAARTLARTVATAIFAARPATR